MAKQAKLEDSNMANYGTDEHKAMMKEAAQKEEAWSKVGQEVGITVWRIEKFKVKAWPKAKYGEFYEGDSYIILNAYKENDDSKNLKFNVHFWLGGQTSQDEAGSAAYKTVELDDYLGQTPVQYREVQGYESKYFLNLFDKIVVLQGGIESGFNKVEPTKYEPRLMRVCGKMKKVQVYPCKLQLNSLNNCDVFILDGGLTLFQFNPVKCNVWEKRKANQIVDDLQNERKIKGKDCKIIDGIDDVNAPEFFKYFGCDKPKEALPSIAPNDADDEKDASLDKKSFEKSVHKVTDESGDVQIKVIAKAKGKKFSKDVLSEADCFIVDLGYTVFVYMGDKATKNEKRESFKYAVKYLNDSGRKPNIPIIRLNRKNQTEEFADNFE